MREDTAFGAFIIGMFVGWMLAIGVAVLPSSNASKYRQAVKECEKTLPRDQHCKVIAIPVAKEQ